MAFKMKAAGIGPMKKNFPGAFKDGKEKKAATKVEAVPSKLVGGKSIMDVEPIESGTKEGAAYERMPGTSYEYRGNYYDTKEEWRAAIKAAKKDK